MGAQVIRSLQRRVQGVLRFFGRVDPGAHRRWKGLRLVAGYAIAVMLGRLLSPLVPHGAALPTLAGGIALWTGVSDAQPGRRAAARDMLLLAAAAVAGAESFVLLSPFCRLPDGQTIAELVLVGGAFAVGYFRRFAAPGTLVGSQIFIGQLLALDGGLHRGDVAVALLGGLLGACSAVMPRLAFATIAQPTQAVSLPESRHCLRTEVVMGLQAACAALAVVGLQASIGLVEPAWAITAAAYVVATSSAATADRAARRILGTLVGVSIALAFLPLAHAAPLLVWIAAALAMVVYAMSVPNRYDVACGARAFILIAMLAAGGQHSLALFLARCWETLLGGLLGLAAAHVIFPLGSETKLPNRSTSTAGLAGDSARSRPESISSTRFAWVLWLAKLV